MTDTAQIPPNAPIKSKKRTIFWLLVAIFLGVLWLLFGRGVGQKTTVAQDDGTPKVYKPVVYDVKDWQATKPSNKPFGEIKTLTDPLGTTARKKSTLDVNGNQADGYHYHSDSEPPLYVVDSYKFFEIAWYYATPNDNDKDKAFSQKYAKSAYQVAGQVVDNPKPLFENLLTNKKIDLPKGVVLAQCKNYLCQVVFEKDKF